MGINRISRSQKLFLLRVWAKGKDDEATDIEWRGKVQRVTDGESHEFSTMQELVDLLLVMLSDNKRR